VTTFCLTLLCQRMFLANLLLPINSKIYLFILLLCIIDWAEVRICLLRFCLLDSTAGPSSPVGSAPRTLRGGEFDWVLFDPTWRDFVLTQREKLEKFDFFRGNFPNPNYRWLTRPDLTRATKKWPNQGQNFLTRTHHYIEASIIVSIILILNWYKKSCTEFKIVIQFW